MAARATSNQMCACGCGEFTLLWDRTNTSLGWRKGAPQKWLNGHNAKGRVISAETKRRIGASHFLRKSVSWKGEKADYSAIHHWVRNHFAKTGFCEHCGEAKKTEWANINHLYDREKREDWLELCRSCHVKFDRRK